MPSRTSGSPASATDAWPVAVQPANPALPAPRRRTRLDRAERRDPRSRKEILVSVHRSLALAILVVLAPTSGPAQGYVAIELPGVGDVPLESCHARDIDRAGL